LGVPEKAAGGMGMGVGRIRSYGVLRGLGECASGPGCLALSADDVVKRFGPEVEEFFRRHDEREGLGRALLVLTSPPDLDLMSFITKEGERRIDESEDVSGRQSSEIERGSDRETDFHPA
jgi:hypothetical protein